MNRLYCFGESGNAYKAALTLTMAEIDWEPVFVDFFNGEARSPAFRAINPMGEVPVLDAGGLILTQSGVIQDWAAETSGRFGGHDPQSHRDILRWVIFDNQKVSGTAGPLRFLMNFLPEEKRDPAVIAWVSGRMHAALSVLEAELSKRDWLVGDGPSLADFACCGYLYYPENFGFARSDYPAIAAWLERLAAQPLWQHPYDLLPKPTLGVDDGTRP